MSTRMQIGKAWVRFEPSSDDRDAFSLGLPVSVAAMTGFALAQGTDLGIAVTVTVADGVANSRASALGVSVACSVADGVTAS